MCAGPPPPSWPARRSATSSGTARAYDVQVWSTPDTRASVTASSDLPIDTPCGQRPPRRRRRRDPSGPSRTRSTGERIAAHRRRRQRRRARSGLGRRRARGPADSREVRRSATMPSCSANTPSARRRRPPAVPAVAAARRRSSCCCRRPSGSWRLALLVIPHLADGAGRRGFRRLMSRRDHLAGLAGWLLHGLRDRGPQRHPADQPLPASGKHEGEPFGRALVLRGAAERLAPILMTTLATGLALVPLVVMGNVPAMRSSTRWPSSSSAGLSPPPC